MIWTTSRPAVLQVFVREHSSIHHNIDGGFRRIAVCLTLLLVVVLDPISAKSEIMKVTAPGSGSEWRIQFIAPTPQTFFSEVVGHYKYKFGQGTFDNSDNKLFVTVTHDQTFTGSVNQSYSWTNTYDRVTGVVTGGGPPYSQPGYPYTIVNPNNLSFGAPRINDTLMKIALQSTRSFDWGNYETDLSFTIGGHFVQTDKLSNEFLTSWLVGDVENQLFSFTGVLTATGKSAVRKLDTDERGYELSKLHYQIKPLPERTGSFTWFEVFTPENNPATPADESKALEYTSTRWDIPATTTESPIYAIDPTGQDPLDKNPGKRHPTTNGTYTIFPFSAELAVDANRDGQIKLASEDPSDATSDGNPFRFWLNDDIDHGHTVDGNDYEQDDISPTEAATNNWEQDWKPNKVGFTRDLEDFARIVVSTSGLNDALKNGDLYLGLKWTDTVGTPSIKLYKQYDATGSTSYLTDDHQASVQLAENAILNQRYASDDPASPSAHTVGTPDDLFVLPQALWFGLSGDALKRSLLFECCTAGKGQLKLVMLKKDGSNYTEIGDGPGVWLDLKNIKDMYEHWTAGQGPVPYGGGAPGALSQASSFTYTAQSPEESKYILYVHGWNMEQWEKERFAETAYKRLYWQGYKGRFGLFSWPTTNGFSESSAIADSTNYDRGEFSAWRSASLLEQKLAQLNGQDQYPGQVYLLAHSMGNVVAGEALRRAAQDGQGVIVRTYVATQAALPVHCYNGSLPDQLDFDLSAIPASGVVRVFDGGWPQTANAYKSWLASNSAAVAKRVNFYNVNDWALWQDKWQLNQWFKPDHSDFRPNPPDPQRNYLYLDNISQPPTQDGFGWVRLDGSSDPSDRFDIANRRVAVLRLGNAADVKGRYEIMAMACEARSRALGATADDEGFRNPVSLASVWPADNSGDARSYSRHKWHSAQFRSTNMLQKGYWQKLLSSDGFNISTQP